MHDLGFIDLTCEPEKLPPVPVRAVALDRVLRWVYEMLESAGATPKDILTIYTDDPVIWPLPPRRLVLGRTECGFSYSLEGEPVQRYQQTHERFRKLVRKFGMTPYVRGELCKELGATYGHPLAFTPSEASEEAANLFSLEFILMLSGGALFVQETSVFRFFKDKRTVYSRVELNKKLSAKVTAGWVQNVLSSPRGQVLYPTFDAIDRVLLWVESNMSKQESWRLRALLAWLKAAQRPKTAYDLEQKLRLLEPIEPPDEEVRRYSIYTHDHLNYARDLWLDDSKDPHDAFREFYGFIVPSHMDDETFRKIFKTGMVLKKEFTPALIDKIDLGISRFENWFLRRIAKHG